MIIYKTTNLINGKFYIGKDKYNNPNYIGSGKLLKLAINKYGKINFIKEMIEECDDEESLNIREIYWINHLDSINNGYNIALGGEGGDTISNHPNRDLIAKKQSQWMLNNNPTKGRIRTDEELDKWRKSYGDKWKGKNNPNFGSKRSDDTKKLMSEIRKEWQQSLPNKERQIINKKISESNKGKEGYWKGKTNNIHSKWMKDNNPMQGKTHTDEVKQMSSKINSKPKTNEHKKNISLNSPNNKQCIIEGINYRSVAEAARQLMISENTIRGRIKNKNFKEWKVN